MGADSFVFNEGDDVIQDFQVNVDNIILDSGLWGGAALSTDEVIGFATAQADSVVFDFGGGNTLTVLGITDIGVLGSSISW